MVDVDRDAVHGAHTSNWIGNALIPPFSGAGLSAYAKDGAEITDKIFAPNGFMKVDADYSGKPYEQWSASDWPRTYQSGLYPNMFACGIAFVPPHAMSKPMRSPSGTPISPTPPRIAVDVVVSCQSTKTPRW